MDVPEKVEDQELQMFSSEAIIDDLVREDLEQENDTMTDTESESDGSDCEVDDADNEADEDKSSNQITCEAGTSSKRKGKKRKRPSNQRRNIRKIFRQDQLDARTLEAQQQEQERLKRLEMQRNVPEKMPNSVAPEQQITKSDDKNEYSSDAMNSVIVLDDDNDYEEPEYDDQTPEKIILISSSEGEEERDVCEENQGYSSDEGADVNFCDENLNGNGNIQINVNHPIGEPDIFLPSCIADVVKPHQISGIRFLYDNLIESLTNFKQYQGFGCVLAHSMGLGKTIQTISLIHVFLKYTPARKVLIIVPINTLQNWLCEFNMWLPEYSDSNEKVPMEADGSKPKDTLQEDKTKDLKRSSFNEEILEGKEARGSSKNELSIISSDDLELNEHNVDKFKTNNSGEIGIDTIDRTIPTKELSHVKIISTGEESQQDQNMEKKNTEDANPNPLKQIIYDDEAAMEAKKEENHNSMENTVKAKEQCFSTNDNDVRDYQVFLIGDSQKNTLSRAKVIGRWHQDGGVLLMGYEMYRAIAMYTPSLCNSVTNAKGKKKKQKAKQSATVIDIEEEEREMQLFLGMQGALCKPGPDLVVCDEGHRIKNHQSNIHQALHQIQTRKRLVLTGYPLQNNLTEYWCMVDFVRPSYLGTRQEFQNMFERPIINGQCVDSTPADKKLMKYRAHVLSSLLKGFVQRKGYAALKTALPPKQEHVIMVRLSPVQEAVYRRFIELMQEGYGEQLNPIRLFAVCTKIWNHPDILYKAMKADKSKKSILFDTDEDIAPEDGPKAKQQKSNSKIMQGGVCYFPDEGLNPFGGDARSLLLKITDWAKEVFEAHQFKEGLIETSGKFFLLMQIIEDSLAVGDKILIFSQSLMTLDLIEEILGRTKVNAYTQDEGRTWKKNLDYYRIDGSTPAVEREKLIDSFNNEENKDAKVFMLSTRAGCLGINLVGANRVVVFDVSWNPCHDAQAVCRIYRYGQRKLCYIYRLVASNTMEKRMYYRQISKQGVSDRVIDELNPAENFTKDEVNRLLSTKWENEPLVDYTEECKQFDDPVLRRVCQTCGDWIVTTPFQHESLLEDQDSSRLSRAEKREATQGYVEEKRRSTMAINGPYSIRGPRFPTRSTQGFPIMQQPALRSSFGSMVTDATRLALQRQYATALQDSSLMGMPGVMDVNRFRSILTKYRALTEERNIQFNNLTQNATQLQSSTNGEMTQTPITSAAVAGNPVSLNSQAELPRQTSLPNISSLWNNGGAITEVFNSTLQPSLHNLQYNTQCGSASTSTACENTLTEAVSNPELSTQGRHCSEVICLDTDDDDDIDNNT